MLLNEAGKRMAGLATLRYVRELDPHVPGPPRAQTTRARFPHLATTPPVVDQLEADELFAEILNSVLLHSEPHDGGSSPHSTRLIRRAEQLSRGALASSIRLEAVGRAVGASPIQRENAGARNAYTRSIDSR